MSQAERNTNTKAMSSRMEGNGMNVKLTHLDFLCPSSISPSTSVTFEIEATSPLSPETVTVVSSRSNHSVPHRVIFLFFQCQLAVEGGRAMSRDLQKMYDAGLDGTK